MGHQFGANHTFNTANDLGNRNGPTAYEPGSGSTIMAYAGIEGSEDLQPHSDPYFHSASIDEIRTYLGTIPLVGTSTPTGNSAPTVSAGSSYTIPTGTPLVLTATGSDPDGDSLTYDWQERDLGPARLLTDLDNGSSPILRDWAPAGSPSRVVPRLSDLVTNTFAKGEMLPAVARSSFKWRVIARDNRSGGGGVATSDVTLSVVNTGSAFAVTSPNTAVTWNAGTTQTVTWNVAGTTANGINVANVKISLSTDGGLTYPTVLLASTPNNGTAGVIVPNVSTTAARIKVEAVGNIFFDISNANFTITVSPPPAPSTPVLDPSTDGGVVGDNITNFNEPKFTGTAEAGSTVKIYSDGTLVGSGVATGGNYAITITTVLTDATHNITATATNAAGTGPASGPRAVTIDTAGEVPSVPVLDPSTDSGAVGDNITSFTLPTFDGTGENGATVTIYSDGSSPSNIVGSGVVTSSVYRITLTTALTDGTHSITAKAVDLAGNIGAMSGPLSVAIDTQNPTVTSVTPSLATVADANVGTATFWVTVVFSEAMNQTVAPTLTFTPDVASTLTLNGASSGWTSSTTYVAKYNVADAGVTVPNTGIGVTLARDLAGNVQVAYNGTNNFSIDTQNPTVTSVIPSLTTVADANIGTAQWPPTAAGVDFRVTFNEAMSGTLPYPTLSFTPNVSTTLHFSFGFWINNTTYLAAYDVLGPTVPYVPGVGVGVTGGRDLVGNVQTPYQGTDDFDLNPNPVTVVSAVPFVTKITDVNVGNAGDPTNPNAGFAVRITYSGPMNIQPYSYPTVTFAPGVSSTLTPDPSQSWWINAYTYKAAYDVSDANIVVSAVGIRSAGALDQAAGRRPAL